MPYRTALITGASSGLGRALALALARQGTLVVAAARRLPELEALVEEIEAAGGKAEALVLDVADTGRTVVAIRALDERLGGLELVIANAGISTPTPGLTQAWEVIEPSLQTNFLGAVATLSAAMPRMVARRRGHLVAVSSLAAARGMPYHAAYCGSKAGLSTFMEGLRLDLLRTGVRVTTVHPGFVRTPLVADNPFPMPFALEAGEAAELILRALPAAPARIDFPFPMTLASGLLRFVPRWLYDLTPRLKLR